MPNLEQIQAQMKTLQAQAEALIASRSQSTLNKIRQIMAFVEERCKPFGYFHTSAGCGSWRMRSKCVESK